MVGLINLFFKVIGDVQTPPFDISFDTYTSADMVFPVAEFYVDDSFYVKTYFTPEAGGAESIIESIQVENVVVKQFNAV